MLIYLPLPGTYIFRNKQSSDWLTNSGTNFFKYWYLPLGMYSRAAVLLDTSGSFCGQTAPKVSASLVPGQGSGGCGSLNLSGPTGGAAYGTPRKTSTGSRCREFSSRIMPRIAPV